MPLHPAQDPFRYICCVVRMGLKPVSAEAKVSLMNVCARARACVCVCVYVSVFKLFDFSALFSNTVQSSIDLIF
jgi:hypothetical protein